MKQNLVNDNNKTFNDLLSKMDNWAIFNDI